MAEKGEEMTKTHRNPNIILFSLDSCFANRAIEDGEPVRGTSSKLSLQYGFDPVVEAALANIVEGLCPDWRARMAFYWGYITCICKVAATWESLYQRIFFLLRDGFAQFFQFLCFLGYLFLQGKYSDLSINEMVSELEKGRDRYLRGARRSYRFDYFDGAFDSGQDSCSGCGRCGDSNRIHFYELLSWKFVIYQNKHNTSWGASNLQVEE